MIFLMLLFLFWLHAADYSPVIDPDKFTVCAITINSDDEKKVFEREMKKHPNKFNPIVELTNFGQEGEWFQKSCSK